MIPALPALHAWQTEKGTRAQAVARGKLIKQSLHNVPDFDQKPSSRAMQTYVTLITSLELFTDLKIPEDDKLWLLQHFREIETKDRRDFTPNPMLLNAYSTLVKKKIDSTLKKCRVAEVCMKCLSIDLTREFISNENNPLTLERISDEAISHMLVHHSQYEICTHTPRAYTTPSHLRE
jgi:hypothetical protein